MKKGLLIETPPLDVYEQMACDEILCETLPAAYIIRFFNWKGVGVTFGFSQRFTNVFGLLDEKRRTYPITRRPTGGGVVIHEYDLTFSLIFYSPEEFNPIKTYDMLHKSIYEEYRKSGFSIDIVYSKTDYKVNNPTMECFKKPVEMDLMMGEKKVLGGALRKFSDYMLYQASLQLPDARYDPFHKDLITSAFRKLFNIEFTQIELSYDLMRKIEDKKNQKYSNKNWIARI